MNVADHILAYYDQYLSQQSFKDDQDALKFKQILQLRSCYLFLYNHAVMFNQMHRGTSSVRMQPEGLRLIIDNFVVECNKLCLAIKGQALCAELLAVQQNILTEANKLLAEREIAHESCCTWFLSVISCGLCARHSTEPEREPLQGGAAAGYGAT